MYISIQWGRVNYAVSHAPPVWVYLGVTLFSIYGLSNYNEK